MVGICVEFNLDITGFADFFLIGRFAKDLFHGIIILNYTHAVDLRFILNKKNNLKKLEAPYLFGCLQLN